MANTLAINAGAALNATPATTQSALATNYVDFTATTTQGWAQQYLPELMEKEAEVFGNRTVAGFLEMVGAEEAMASDQVVWSEQGRLHLSYTGTHGSEGVITITKDIDGNDIDGAGEAGIGIRAGDMVLLSTAGGQAKCYVTETTNVPGAAISITVKSYSDALVVSALGGQACDSSTAVNVFVFGSEFKKGQDGRTESNDAKFKSYSNQPLIMKDMFHISGSDAAQIGWVEVSGEEGQNGFLWYLKSAGDTKSRFADYCEMALIESEKAAASSGVEGLTAGAGKGLKGTEGLFAAIESRGNVAYQANATNDLMLEEFDEILAEFDKQGAIEEYMMFLNRPTALAVDDMLAAQNSDSAGGSSYGVFNNEEKMALNLGFSGFRRGSYDFYKSDWKYLNDQATRGGMAAATTFGAAGTNAGLVNGVFIPAGVSSVYDQSLGKNLKRPFLHVRYRAAGNEDRKFKTWTTGSVGASTSALDAMEMHFLTERCLVVQGANNFMLLRG